MARGFGFDALGIRMMPGRCPNRDWSERQAERHQREKPPDDDFEAGQFSSGALGQRAFQGGRVEVRVRHHGDGAQSALHVNDTVSDEGGRVGHGGQYRPGGNRVG